MNVKYLIPFVEAAYEVMKAEVHTEFARGDLALDKNHYVTDDVTVIISLVGDVRGNVFYSMDSQTAVAVASAMLDEQFSMLDGLAQSGIAELGNVITGRASVKLSHAGYETTISPPTLLLGKGATISTLDIPRLIVPLMGKPGKLMVHLALRESAEKGLNSAQLKVPGAPRI
jgi:chemotaxis protein CheX